VNRIGYRDSVVSFIDILGFRGLLEQQSDPNVIADVVIKVRDALSPEGSNRRKGDPKGRLISRAVGFSLSDAVVRIRPFDTAYRDGALFHELLDLMHAQGQLLSQGIVIRGAVTVGRAYAHRTNDLAFGPAVAEAYEWESQRAVYPRIVLTERALSAYDSDKRLRAESEQKETKSLLSQSEDGLYFIDYIKGLEGEYDHIGSYYQFLAQHKKVIDNGLASAVNGSTVKQKYQWMAFQHKRVIERYIRASKSEANRSAFWSEFETDMAEFFKSLRVKAS
jgi:hypothetical protein